MDRVNQVTAECFNALIQIRTLGDEGGVAPEMFHSRLVGFIEAFRRTRSRAMGLAVQRLAEIELWLRGMPASPAD